MNESSQGKPAPMFRRYSSKAQVYSKATVPAMPAAKRTPASPFMPIKLIGKPIPREEEEDC